MFPDYWSIRHPVNTLNQPLHTAFLYKKITDGISDLDFDNFIHWNGKIVTKQDIDVWTTAFNSLRLSDACMRHQPSPSFVQVMACRLIGTKPLSEPMLYLIVNCTIRNKRQSNCIKISKIFIQENGFENVVWKMLSILSLSQCVNAIIDDKEVNLTIFLFHCIITANNLVSNCRFNADFIPVLKHPQAAWSKIHFQLKILFVILSYSKLNYFHASF